MSDNYPEEIYGLPHCWTCMQDFSTTDLRWSIGWNEDRSWNSLMPGAYCEPCYDIAWNDLNTPADDPQPMWDELTTIEDMQ